VASIIITVASLLEFAALHASSAYGRFFLVRRRVGVSHQSAADRDRSYCRFTACAAQVKNRAIEFVEGTRKVNANLSRPFALVFIVCSLS